MTFSVGIGDFSEWGLNFENHIEASQLNLFLWCLFESMECKYYFLFFNIWMYYMIYLLLSQKLGTFGAAANDWHTSQGAFQPMKKI